MKLIGSWRMSLDGLMEGYKLLKSGSSLDDVIVKAVSVTEDNPLFNSVGFGGLPNEKGMAEFDAAYMDGATLGFGAVMSVTDIKNPIVAANLLSKHKRNSVLAGKGAEIFAKKNGLTFQNMLTDASIRQWEVKRKEVYDSEQLEAYNELKDSHDTVCVLAQDQQKNLAAGVSTSGLFMKWQGRISDSPIIGSGLYCDNKYGAAAATGVGEDIMKGCLSYEIVRLMKNGCSAQEACEKALLEHYDNFLEKGHAPGSMAVLAIGKSGDFGSATTAKEFPVVRADESGVKVYLTNISNRKMVIEEASEQWLKDYEQRMREGTGV